MKLLQSILVISFLSIQSLSAQSDKKEAAVFTLKTDSSKTIIARTDSTPAKPKHIPRIATRRSALIPGWGQAYNREYWKIPIVYGALAIPTFTFIDNNNYYKMCKFAYDAVFAATDPNNTGIKDTSMLRFIDPKVKRSDGTPLGLTDYQNYRNTFRRNRDYSIFWFIIVWGLNVVDATVFAHLKDFDISSDLSMHVQPNLNIVTKLPEMGLVLNFKNTHKQAKNIGL
jgi:hypothetical protein